MSTNKWNRSSAFTPEVLGIVTEVMTSAVQNAIAKFDHALGDLSLTDEQKVAAYALLANGVTEGIALAVEDLKK